MKKIAVIGTAGRKDDAKHIDRALYDAMYQETRRAILDWECTGAVSGGAAVADHLAVRAFLEGAVESLTLYLPAYFENGAFVSNPRVQFNPGKTSNTYHQAFSKACGIDSLAEIAQAISRGAEVVVKEGFHNRNLEVAADCYGMLALTFGTGIEPVDLKGDDEGFRRSSAGGLKDGGTAHTWESCWKADVKRHVDLFWLVREMASGLAP